MSKAFTLVGVDGNAFSIMGYTVSAMKQAKFDAEEIKKYRETATSGDYNNVICTSMDILNQVNEKLGLNEEDDEEWDYDEDEED